MLARSCLFGPSRGHGALPSPPPEDLNLAPPAPPSPDDRAFDAVDAGLRHLDLFGSPELVPIPVGCEDEFELFPFELGTPPSSPASPVFGRERLVPPPAPRLRPKELPTLPSDRLQVSPLTSS